MSPNKAHPGQLPTVREMLTDGRVHLLDGAMGTLLYERGIFLNVCYDELSETHPDLVESIHREYIDAGAELIETNTFGANPIKLSGFGLDERTEALNRSAAALAVRAAGGRARVLGAVGPLGIRIEPWGPTSAHEARAFFRRQLRGLVEGGVDGIMLETFQDPAELQQALLAARDVCDLPVIALVSVGEGGRTAHGAEVESIVTSLESWGADAAGFNCSVGPAEILDAIERASEVSSLPLVAQPNAGLPRTVGDRKMYLASPEYMARYARRMIEAGVRFVGGCCGTTPEHIRRIVEVLPEEDRELRRARGAGQAQSPHRGMEARGDDDSSLPDTLPVALQVRSDFGRALAEGAFVVSVELVPPRGWNTEELLDGARRLRAAGVEVATIPDAPRGLTRMGALPAAVLLAGVPGVEVIAHYACRDRNMIGMISDLMGAAASGTRNLLLVTGDPPPTGPYPDRTSVFDIDSIGLTNVVHHLNLGEEPGGRRITPPTRFVIGVAVNTGASDRELEDRRFRFKVEAGADFAVTQPLFDPEELQSFRARHPSNQSPIIVGVRPLESVEDAEVLANEVPGVRIPAELIERMRAAEGEGLDAAEAEGVRIAIEVAEAVRSFANGIHVTAPRGRLDLAIQVVEGVRSRRPDRSSQ